MLEQLIAETKERHSKRPVSQESYSKWRNSTVTRRLFEDLELAVVDSFQDYLPDSPDEIIIQSMLRQGGAQMVERVLDWSPAGVDGPNDEDN
jgi:hypothetical protein